MVSLYDLFKAIILSLNALAIINERFLRQVGWEKPSPDAEATPKNRLLQLLHGEFKTLLIMPLLICNTILILVELLVG